MCIVACPPPGSGTNTEPVPQTLTCSPTGTVYTYECSHCYFLPADDLVTTCQNNGRWSLPPPTCEEGMYLAVIKIGLSLLYTVILCISQFTFFIFKNTTFLYKLKNTQKY